MIETRAMFSRVPLTSVFVAACILVAAGPAAASRAAAALNFGGGGGAEWFTTSDQSTGIAYGYAGLTSGRASLALGGLRFSDRDAGAGVGPLAAICIPTGTSLAMRAWGTQFLGDGDLRAYRLKSGPECTLPRDATLGLYFTYLDSNLGGVSRGGTAELGIPIRAGLTGRLSGAATRLPGSITSTQGSLGLAWAPDSRFELSAEAGLARNGSFSTVSSPGASSPGGPLGLPIGIGPDPSRPGNTETRFTSGTDPTLSLGLRVALP